MPAHLVSSPGVVRTFCRVCGTPLTYANEKTPGEVDVTTVSMDEETSFPPTRELWVSHRVNWEVTDPARAQYPQGASPGPCAQG
jgi:hypothetical protein